MSGLPTTGREVRSATPVAPFSGIRIDRLIGRPLRVAVNSDSSAIVLDNRSRECQKLVGIEGRSRLFAGVMVTSAILRYRLRTTRGRTSAVTTSAAGSVFDTGEGDTGHADITADGVQPVEGGPYRAELNVPGVVMYRQRIIECYGYKYVFQISTDVALSMKFTLITSPASVIVNIGES